MRMQPELLVMLGLPGDATDAEVETAYLGVTQVWRQRRLGATSPAAKGEAEEQERRLAEAYGIWTGRERMPDLGLPSARGIIQGKGPEIRPEADRAMSKSLFAAVRIAQGTFLMGSPPDDKGAWDDEAQHEVTLTTPIEMMTTPVTQAHWLRIFRANPSSFKGHLGRPVDTVSWYDAVAFANALSIADGLPPAYFLSEEIGTLVGGDYRCSAQLAAESPYLTCGWRLPTEAEWEYACRAGSTTARYNGSDSGQLDEIAWFQGNSAKTTHPVGGKVPNAWGLHDMLGNVWEWCWDWYDDYPGTVTDPVGPASGSLRVARGGSWNIDASNTRAAPRNRYGPGTRGNLVGFRLVRSRP